MDFIDKAINFFKLAANGIKDIEFLKYFFPIIAVIGSVTFLYYGYKGIFFKSTIYLYKARGFKFSDTLYATSVEAIILGVTYIIIGISLLFFLGGISYYIWF